MTRVNRSLGVTEIIDLEMAYNMTDWKRRIAHGNDLLRIHAGVYQPHLEQAIQLGLKTGDLVEGTRGLVHVGPHKIITDGSLGSRTAYCHDAERAIEHGFKLAIHALGDKAISKTLEVLESLPVRPLDGSSIEHAQLLRLEDREAFKRLGLIASVQPVHMIDDRPLCATFWPGREERAFAYRSMVDAGIPLRLGSDCPVAPLQPWEAMAVAVGRTERGFEMDPWHAEQAIDVETAWRATTWIGKSGIEVGDRADMILIDRDPLGCDAKGLRETEVLGTMLGGRWTFRRTSDMNGAEPRKRV
jgi:predicted amidohydrolase YtcJ